MAASGIEKQRVLILGARANGHASVVLDILDAQGVAVAGFLDDDPAKWGQSIRQRPVLGGLDGLVEWSQRLGVTGAIGAVASNAQRRAWIALIRQAGLLPINAIHPTAHLASNVTLGVGICICPGVIVMPGARLGDAVTLYTAATVDHDCVLADGVNLSPGVLYQYDAAAAEDLKKYDRRSGKLLWTSPEIPDARAIPGIYTHGDKVILQIGGQVETQAPQDTQGESAKACTPQVSWASAPRPWTA